MGIVEGVLVKLTKMFSVNILKNTYQDPNLFSPFFTKEIHLKSLHLSKSHKILSKKVASANLVKDLIHQSFDEKFGSP